jgi:glucosamine kinase
VRLCLGLDGGGSGCRARLTDAAGHVLGQGEAGPANIMSDMACAEAAIRAAAAAALGPHDPAQVVACLGLAGAIDPAARAGLARRLPFARTRIETDGFIAVRGALGESDGIVAVLGTGSAFAVQRGGQVSEIGGKGLILGDEGSGGWIGRAILSATLRAVDGFVPMTPLNRAILDEMGGPDGIISFAATARPADFASLAPRVAGSADPAARRIIASAAAEIAASVALLQRGEDLPVVCHGGLSSVFAPLLAARWRVVEPAQTALDGACRLARGLLPDGAAAVGPQSGGAPSG